MKNNGSQINTTKERNLSNKKLKVAIIHDYLVQYGGAEKTLEALLELYPEADIYTGIYVKENMSELINKHNVIGPTNVVMSRFRKFFTFLMPFVFENFDLSKYDLVISEGTAWPKGVLTTPDQLHISYVHTPPRFLYGYSVETAKRNAWYLKPFVAVIDHLLRIWDFAAAQRPDYLLTNSNETKSRIEKFYKRDAKVIYPPVEIDKPYTKTSIIDSLGFNEYYLALGRLSIYKNFDFLVDAFAQTNKNLVIAGSGKEESNLRQRAQTNANIVLLGRVSEDDKHTLLEHCKALINAVEDEDLGIVPIEAMSHGKPVLAFKSGGHLETIKEGVSGEYFDKLDVENFLVDLEGFESNINKGKYDTNSIKSSVKSFNKERFKQEFSDFIAEKLENSDF